jgi:hypothetical protein
VAEEPPAAELAEAGSGDFDPVLAFEPESLEVPEVLEEPEESAPLAAGAVATFESRLSVR